MLGATHTKVIMKMAELVGCGFAPDPIPAGLAMIFGNLLPDNLPVVGVSSEKSHDISRAKRLRNFMAPLGTGVIIHIYTDNLTHCNCVMNNGKYEDSVALKLGRELMEETSGRFMPLVEKFSKRSVPYTLHTVIELAADVLSAQEPVVDLIECSWAASENRSADSFETVGEIYDIDCAKLIEGTKKFPPKSRPNPEALYSRRARAELFLRKFAPKDYDYSNVDVDRTEIIELIESGEKMLADGLTGLVDDFAGRILDAEPELGDGISGILNSDGKI